MWWTSLRAERTEPLYYLHSYTAAPTLNLTLRLSITLTLLLQMPRTLNYRRAACHPNRLRSPLSTAHQQQVHKSYKWSSGFNVNGRTFHVIAVRPTTYRMAYIHHIASLTTHMYARRRIQPRMCVIHWRPWLRDRRVGSAPPPPCQPVSLVLNRHGRTDVMAMKSALGGWSGGRPMHVQRSPPARWVTTWLAGSPTPLHGPHCQTPVSGPSPVTARSHRCDTHYTSTALRSPPSVSC